MNKKLKCLLITLTSSILLAGCCTSHHAPQWEYKAASPKGNARIDSVQEAFLNETAKDGWLFVQKDADGTFIFKRVKK